MIKSSLFKKPGRKSRLLKYMSEFVFKDDVSYHLSLSINSWFEAAIHHATRIHLYEGFYKAEKGQGTTVEHIIELVIHKTIYNDISTQLYFIKENSQQLMAVSTSLEAKKVPLACTVYKF